MDISFPSSGRRDLNPGPTNKGRIRLHSERPTTTPIKGEFGTSPKGHSAEGLFGQRDANRLRQKEAVKGLTKRIEGQIVGGEAKSDEGEELHYDPLLESKSMGLFEKAFRRALI